MVGVASIIGGVSIIFGFSGIGIYLYALGAIAVAPYGYGGSSGGIGMLLFVWQLIAYIVMVLVGIGLIALDIRPPKTA